LNLQLGLFHASTDELDKAQEYLTKASEIDPTSADAHYYLGLISAARASLAPAVRLFQRAFELRSGDLTLAYQLAVAARAASQNGIHIVLRPIEHTPFADCQEDSSQVRQLANYITYEPDFIEAFLALPKSEMDQKLFGTLVDVTQMALAGHPDYADLHLHCCRMMQRIGQDQQALKHARQAAAINPRYTQAHVQIGKICARLGRDKEAIKAIQSAIRCGADWPDVHLLAGQLEAKRRRPDQAKAHLQRALKLNANYDPAAKALVALAA
jgi:tetratricopeptide (TPR) repeat protein